MQFQSELEIESIVDQIDVAVAAVDRQYVYRWANRAYLERFDQSCQELVGQPMAIFFQTEQFLGLIKPKLDECLTGQKIQAQNWYCFGGMGNQLIEVTYNPYREADKTISGVVITLCHVASPQQPPSLQQLNQELIIQVKSKLPQQVPQSQATETALTVSNQTIRAIIDNAPAVIYLKDLQSRLQLVNRKFEQVFNLTKAQIMGRSDRQLFPPDIAAAFAANDQVVIEGKRALKTEEQVVQADGKLHTYLSTKFPIFAEDGQVIAIGGVAIDITRRKQAQAALGQRLRQQAAIAELSRQALAAIELDKLFEEATKILAENLEVEYIKVLELSEDGNLSLKAGFGWQESSIAQGTFSRENSQAGYTLATGQPVVVEDLSTETRFQGSNLLSAYKIKSGISTIIEGQVRPFGVLEVYTTQKRSFTEDDVNFVRSVANILAGAIPSVSFANAFQQEKKALQTSEERFRATFEQAAVGIAHVAPDGKWLRVNQKLCQIVGYSSEELTKKTFQDITYSEDLQTDLEYVRQILAGEIPTYSLEKRYIRRDKRIVWINLTVSLVRSEQGIPEYFIAVVEDIEGRKQLEASLDRSLQRLNNLHRMDQAILATQEPEAIANTAMTYLQKILPCRRITTAIFERDRSIARVLVTIGEGETEFGSGFESEQKLFQPLIEQFQAGKNYAIGDLSLFGDSSPMQRLKSQGLDQFVALPFRVDGHLLGILKIWLDQPDALSNEQLEIATEVSNQLAIALNQNQLYQDLKAYATDLETRVAQRTAKLEEINDELKAFSYSISHDLKAPLRAIQGFASALAEDYQDSLDELGREYTGRLIASAGQMDRLINDLLSYSRLSRADLRLQPVDLSTIVKQAIEQLELQISQTGAKIRVDEPLESMLGNSGVLLQVVSNLLSNAIKFVQPTRSPLIQIRTESRGDRLRLWIEDNGIGIDRSHQDRIFRVFERLHGIETYPGTGIGLAIVKKGMERLGGQAGVESEIGRGSRFWIEGAIG